MMVTSKEKSTSQPEAVESLLSITTISLLANLNERNSV